MRTAIHLAALILCAALSLPAYADWTVTGVAALCDPDAGRFALLSVVTSSDEATTYSPPEAVHKKFLLPIKDGRNELRCRIGKNYEILVDLINSKPSATGSGNGAGYVQIEKLLVNGIQLLGITGFNEVNPNRDTMMRLELRAFGDILGITACSINGWANRNDLAAVKCTYTK